MSNDHCGGATCTPTVERLERELKLALKMCDEARAASARDLEKRRAMSAELEDLRHPNKHREDWGSDHWVEWQKNENPLLPKHGRHLAHFVGNGAEVEGTIYSTRNGTRMFVAGNWVGPGVIRIEDDHLMMGFGEVVFTKLEEGT